MCKITNLTYIYKAIGSFINIYKKLVEFCP